MRVDKVLCVLCVVWGLGCASKTVTDEAVSSTANSSTQGAVLPLQPCNPETDGWKPTPIPLSAEQQQQQQQGQPFVIYAPPGYQAEAPPGVPYCGPGDVWAINCNADSDCPKSGHCQFDGICVMPCSADTQCAAPRTCVQGGPAGISTCRCLACEQRGVM